MSTQKKNDHITIRVEAALKAELEARAKKDDRTLSAYVGRLLRQHVESDGVNAGRKRSSAG